MIQKRRSFDEALLNERLIKGIKDLLIVMDKDGRMEMVNQPVEDLLGYKSGELKGKKIDKVIENGNSFLRRLLAKKELENYGTTFYTEDGKELPLNLSASVVMVDKKIDSIILLARDTRVIDQLLLDLKRTNAELTEQSEKLEETVKERTEELRKSKDYMENIVKSMIDTLIVVTPEGNIETVNQATLNLLGYKEDELIGKPVAIIFAEEEEEEEELPFKGTKMKKLIEEGSIRDYGMTYKTKSGEKISISFSGSAMRDKAGELIGIVGIARDMREIKRLMQKEKELAAAAAVAAEEKKRAAELDRAYKELEKERERLEGSYAQLQGSKDELIHSEKLAFTGRIAANIAHEIRNPLTNVVMSVQQIEEAIKPEDPIAEDLEVIKRNTEKTNFLITELLNCARPPKLNIQPHDIHRLLKSVLESAKTKIKSQKIKVIKKFTSKPSKIRLDKEQMERAFSNFVLNAVEAMPARGGELTISTKSDEDIFMVRIRDTGKGIPEEDIIKIYDPFFSSKPNGVGLGLTLCYGVIIGHGGMIEVESKPRKGTEFTISLPISERERVK